MNKLTLNKYEIKRKNQHIKKQYSCRTKKAYLNFDFALRITNSLNAKGIYVKPYLCSICNKYHITKRKKENVLAELFKKIENKN